MSRKIGAYSLFVIGVIGLLAACATPITPTATIAPTAVPTAAPTSTVPPTPTVEPTATPVPARALKPFSILYIPAPALANNLVDEPTEREIMVYLPPSYPTTDKRYPVIYYLPGYGDGNLIGFYLPGDLDTMIKAGKVKETIVVVANGISVLGGSFYVNSPVTGN